MTLTETLLSMEEKFWRGDATFYEEALTADCVMVFPPPAGILDRAQTVAAIANGPRWSSITFDEPQVVSLDESAALLIYRATAQREGDDTPYVALASSGYVQQGGVWRLAFHQQTLAAG